MNRLRNTLVDYYSQFICGIAPKTLLNLSLLLFLLPNYSFASESKVFYPEFEFRQSLLSNKYALTQLDGRLTAGNFVCGMSYTKYLYGPIYTSMSFETIDFEIVGISSTPSKPTIFSFTLGLMHDLRSTKSYPQYTSTLSRQFASESIVKAKARYIGSPNFNGRTELVLSALHPIYRKKDASVFIGLYGMVASYRSDYTNIPMESFGFTGRVQI